MSAKMSAATYPLSGPAKVEINEVAPRDGLQIEPFIVPTEGKVAFVNALARCGFARIEATSFTSARAIPALADAEAVMHQVERVPGVGLTVLVPNLRGLERALSCRPDEVNLVMSSSETHNRANLRMTREEIGSYLGLKLETVSRTFSKFQEDGLIGVQQKNIRIIDSEGLKNVLGRDPA